MGNILDETTASTGPVGEPRKPPAANLAGKLIGEFELQRKLGAGGMGEVYLAHQKSLKRSVAVKLLRPELAANTTALLRFRAEAEAVARINHANIVQVYSIGEQENMHYMVLEYVQGLNLREFLSRKGTPDLPLALKIMRQIAAALIRAGEMGIVHRDIKPENILLTRKGEVKVADFGLSRCFTSEEATNITHSGVTMGTPLYMSPEQVQGKVVDPRSDIYSFGITCYHMLKGETPFRGATAFEVALQHVQNQPPPLAEARPDLPADLCALVHRMIAKKPEDRPQTPVEVFRELQRIGSGLPPAHAPSATGLSAVAAASPTASATTVVPLPAPPTRGLPRWPIAVGILLACAGVGFGLNAAFPRHREPAVATDREVPPAMRANESPNRKRIKELQDLIDDPGRQVESTTDYLLELAEKMVHEKMFDEAEKLFDVSTLGKRGAFKKEAKEFKAVLTLPKNVYLELISHLGPGIVLAMKDQPKASLDEFEAAAKVRRFNPKKETPQVFPPPIDPFLKGMPKWKKAVADALERDAINEPGKNFPANLESYRSYLPRLSHPPAPPPAGPNPK